MALQDMAGMMVMGWRLDFMILEVFSYLDDSVIWSLLLPQSQLFFNKNPSYFQVLFIAASYDGYIFPVV